MHSVHQDTNVLPADSLDARRAGLYLLALNAIHQRDKQHLAARLATLGELGLDAKSVARACQVFGAKHDDTEGHWLSGIIALCESGMLSDEDIDALLAENWGNRECVGLLLAEKARRTIMRTA